MHNEAIIAPEETRTMLSGAIMAEQFSRNLMQNEKALTYVKERGITQNMIDEHLVGFCPSYSHHWFPLMKGRITVAMSNSHGKVIAFAGRQFEPMQELTERSIWETYGHEPAKAEKRIEKWRRGKWINEPFAKQFHLYNLDRAKHAAREEDYIVVVEGYFDALILSKQIPNVIAVCGTALTEHHLALLARYTKNIVLILDPDQAGDKAAVRMSGLIKSADMTPYIVRLPAGLDPDEFVMKYGGKNLKRGIEGMIDGDKTELRINLK